MASSFIPMLSKEIAPQIDLVTHSHVVAVSWYGNASAVALRTVSHTDFVLAPGLS